MVPYRSASKTLSREVAVRPLARFRWLWPVVRMRRIPWREASATVATAKKRARTEIEPVNMFLIRRRKRNSFLNGLSTLAIEFYDTRRSLKGEPFHDGVMYIDTGSRLSRRGNIPTPANMRPKAPQSLRGTGRSQTCAPFGEKNRDHRNSEAAGIRGREQPLNSKTYFSGLRFEKEPTAK